MEDEQQPLTAEQVVDKRIAAILAEIDQSGAMHSWTKDLDAPLERWVEIKAMLDRDRAAVVTAKS